MSRIIPKPSAKSTAPLRRPISTVFSNRFGCLAPKEERVAADTYETVMGMLRTRRCLPLTVWADKDETLYRRWGRQDVLQGHVIGMLGAFRDAGSDVGIFSTNLEKKIEAFVEKHEIIARLIDRGRGSIPLIRGAEYLSEVGRELSMPQSQVTSAIGYFFFRGRRGQTTEHIPKLIGAGELLVDNYDHTNVYDRLDRLCRARVSDWEFTPLAKAMRVSRDGLFHVAARGYAKGLTAEELARLGVVLNHIEAKYDSIMNEERG